MLVLIINAFFILLASFIGFAIYEGLSAFPIYLRIPLTLITTYFILIFFFLVIDFCSRIFLRNAPDFLAPGTFRRRIWGIGAIARKNYFHLLSGLKLVAGQSNLALKLLGLRHGKRFVLIDSHISDPSRVTIGDNVLVGTDVTIGDQFHPFRGAVDRHRISIGHNCLIGGRAVIQNGAQIGDDVIIAILSVVPSGAVLESGWIYGGVPVKKIRPVELEKNEKKKE